VITGGWGVHVETGKGNTVAGNRVGTNAAGTADLAGDGYGVASARPTATRSATT